MFDLEKFVSAKVRDRIGEVKVPELAMFFKKPAKGKKPKYIWKVKALDGIEIAIANQAKEANKTIEELITQFLSNSPLEKVKAILTEIGHVSSEIAPDDYTWRISLLHQASVEPKIDQVQAVRLAFMHGNVFYRITNKITELIGQGKRLGE